MLVFAAGGDFRILVTVICYNCYIVMPCRDVVFFESIGQMEFFAEKTCSTPPLIFSSSEFISYLCTVNEKAESE